jgi:hypothetical protein
MELSFEAYLLLRKVTTLKADFKESKIFEISTRHTKADGSQKGGAKFWTTEDINLKKKQANYV